MSKRILLYYPPNKRSVAIETLCRAVKEAGHDLIVLTLTEKDSFHAQIERMGLATYTTVINRKPSWKYFLNQARFLIGFCKKHKIDHVWSHLQEANFIAILAQPFIKARVTTFRHHAESAFYAEYGNQFGMTRNSREELLDKIINRLAKTIVVPSSGVWYGMEKYESCNMKKVLLLPYIYDFCSYQTPNYKLVKQLRSTFSCELLLIMVSRMIESKQHQPVFEVLHKLKEEGLKIKMIVMDDGPLKAQLENFTIEKGMTDDIIFVGFKTDFINYMAAADLLIHPSLTEASSNVVKEMGLINKTVAVCEGVGDFNDYIVNGKNGFVISRLQLSEGIEAAIRKAYTNSELLKDMGENLHQSVVELFSESQENRNRFLDLIT